MGIIIRKTVFDVMKGMQFWALLVFSVILFVTNGLLFNGRYSEFRARYEKAEASFYPSTAQQILPVPPSPLGFMHDGDSFSMPREYKLQPKGVITPESGNTVNVKLPVVPPLDWTFIITVVFCLFTVLIGYDTISGEREEGTLKLALSHPFSRFRFGVAKYLAVLFVLALAFLLGAVIDMILIGAVHPGILTLDTVASAAALCRGAFLICSLFAFLCILVSAVSPSSPVALLVLLVIWACFTVVIPNTAPVAARAFSSAVSEQQTARATQEILRKDLNGLMNKVRDNAKKGVYHSREELERDAFSAYEEVQVRVLKQYGVYNNAMRERSAAARLLARISPVALFRYAAESLTRTGERREALFRRAVENYSREYDHYILSKVGKLTPRSIWSFSSNFFLNGAEVMISSPQPEEYKGDMRDFPRFPPPSFPLSAGIFAALGDIAGLVFWNLLAAAGAFAAVQRMDVR
jgi:ABC-type multidrug transport system permease subunit